MGTVVIATYATVLGLLGIYGLHRAHLVYLYLRHRRRAPSIVRGFAEKPVVTVQLPLFNEMYVAERLLEAVAGIRWPADRLEVQVLDDSTDETVEIVARKVAELCARGLDVKHLHRTNREGFKAGALELGLHQARGELLLVFDADFIPGAEILEQTVDYFTDEKIGMVQARWGHVNRDYSLLTETQALMLDGHFVIEHGARARAGRFFNFSGTAGIWRKQAILDAGGWEQDTLTEDMDLSYRAQLKGWKFLYEDGAVVPAELPVEMNAFKSQQFRWAKGQIQVAKKLLPTVLRAPIPRAQKLEAFFHLTNNFAYPLLLALCVLFLPTLFFRAHHGMAEALEVDVPFLVFGTLTIAAFYAISQPGRTWGALVRLPILMALCAGLSVNQARAVIEGLVGKQSEFVRTPKHGVRGRREGWSAKKYRAAKTLVPIVELAFAAYYIAAIVIAVRLHEFLTLPFLVLFAFGFAYVGSLSFYQRT